MPIDIVTQHTSIPVKIGVEKMEKGTITNCDAITICTIQAIV